MSSRTELDCCGCVNEYFLSSSKLKVLPKSRVKFSVGRVLWIFVVPSPAIRSSDPFNQDNTSLPAAALLVVSRMPRPWNIRIVKKIKSAEGRIRPELLDVSRVYQWLQRKAFPTFFCMLVLITPHKHNKLSTWLLPAFLQLPSQHFCTYPSNLLLKSTFCTSTSGLFLYYTSAVNPQLRDSSFLLQIQQSEQTSPNNGWVSSTFYNF